VPLRQDVELEVRGKSRGKGRRGDGQQEADWGKGGKKRGRGFYFYKEKRGEKRKPAFFMAGTPKEKREGALSPAGRAGEGSAPSPDRMRLGEREKRRRPSPILKKKGETQPLSRLGGGGQKGSAPIAE